MNIVYHYISEMNIVLPYIDEQTLPKDEKGNTSIS